MTSSHGPTPPRRITRLPHHVTQRGNRRERTFFEDGDYALYLDLLSDAARRAQAEIWSCCLMPNHVHIIIVPSDEDGLWRRSAGRHPVWGLLQLSPERLSGTPHRNAPEL